MAIKLEKLREEKKKGKLSLLIKGSDEVFANTIRRIIIEEVPTLAVEDLEIKAELLSLISKSSTARVGTSSIIILLIVLANTSSLPLINNDNFPFFFSSRNFSNLIAIV